MTDYMTQDARSVAICAYENAIRLGHHYLGGEHFLLALAAADQPAGAALRGRGVTPERVDEEIVRLAGSGLLGDLDRDALAAVGIDVDAVRDRIESSFGQAALQQAARAAHREPGISSWSPRRRSGAVRDGVFLPHAPDVEKGRRNACREAQARHGTQIGVEHVALGLVAVGEGLVPPILSAIGVSAPVLRTAILDRYRQAS